MPAPRKEADEPVVEETHPPVIDTIKAEVHARLDELRPLKDEADKLERALEALEAVEAPRRRGRPAVPEASTAAHALTVGAVNGKERYRVSPGLHR
jgi:hypothetical protein